MGRGVRLYSALEYMLYHQNSLAHVKLGSCFLAASQIFSPLTSAFDCFHSATAPTSRKDQPLATRPCSRGNRPVTIDACTEHVTAGVIVSSGFIAPAFANAAR